MEFSLGVVSLGSLHVGLCLYFLLFFDEDGVTLDVVQFDFLVVTAGLTVISGFDRHRFIVASHSPLTNAVLCN
ncbi:hypothetical protein QL093DRAFT_2220944 [Fusarium oxysporum]|nr:hypothetical protein QL093DRAFT_2220944 [Fusarium oxysporum]